MATPGQDNDMDQQDFLRLLDLFPIVRSSSYCESDTVTTPNLESTGHHGKPSAASSTHLTPVVAKQDNQNLASVVEDGKKDSQIIEDVFWSNLKAAVQQKLGPADAICFCDAFRQVHESLVHEALSLETINKIAKDLEQRMKL